MEGIVVALLILVIIISILQISLIIVFKKVFDSLNVISYTMNNNGINLETRNDIMKVAAEVGKVKDRVKKLEVSEELTKHKIENVSREVSANNPLYRNKKLH